MPVDAAAPTVRRATTRVMSCEASLVVVGPADLDRAVARLHELEAAWSRFRPSSDVSRLNRALGQPTPVCVDTIELVEAIIDGWTITDGCFDPTIVGALIDAGYRTSGDTSRIIGLSDDIEPLGRMEAIVVDRSAGLVRLPVGTGIDPGGIGKGLAADLVVAELHRDGAEGALVEIGGDIRVAGRAPDERGWCIGDEIGDDPVSLLLVDGGVATSSTRRRRWVVGDEVRHHLIDPRTGRVCTTPVVACSVVAGTAAGAEAQTKVGFVLEPSVALDHWERLGLAARLVTVDGRTATTSAWWQFAHSAPEEAPSSRGST